MVWPTIHTGRPQSGDVRHPLLRIEGNSERRATIREQFQTYHIMSTSETCTIRIHKQTWQKLNSMKSEPGESFDDIISSHVIDE